ncbi:MAG TPA: beta-N-acetylhexosaminidase, partial [Flavitalea sp.]|nr:beta-N-acetylhexosaminidase [Flavitalea sp.]
MKYISSLTFLFSLLLIQSEAIAFVSTNTGFVGPLRSRGFALIPAPQAVNLKPQNIIIDGSWSVIAKPGAQGMPLKRLTNGARELHNLSFSAKSQKNIVLEIRPGSVKGSSDSALNAQGYLLTIAPQEIRISGNSPAGLFYGVQSLLQLLRSDDKGRMIAPECEIRDWPSVELRVAHWDTKHHQDRLETLKRYLDQSAFFKINAIAFEIYDKYEFPRHPVIGAPGAFTKAEMQ